MRIGILGTRGIPNNYGGFEQFAEYLAQGLVKRGHQVYVYNSSDHPYEEKEWNGVNILHCKDWERIIGTAGQFIYDLNCILDSRKRNFDVILQLGYTSNSIWHKLLPSTSIIITNMDGLEWKRSKYNNLVKKFLKIAEKLAVDSSNHLVADSIGIQEYLKNEYNKESTFIAYGANLFKNAKPDILGSYNLNPFKYNMLIARMEPENNIEVILNGVSKSKSNQVFLVVGSTNNDFGKFLKKKFKANNRIKFLGPIYDLNLLNNLRFHSNLYFHGHSVGGTNPSLLEAMASSSLIVAHCNSFNKSVLDDDAFYFSNEKEVSKILDIKVNQEERHKIVQSNREKIESNYSWNAIIKSYESLFLKLAKIIK